MNSIGAPMDDTSTPIDQILSEVNKQIAPPAMTESAINVNTRATNMQDAGNGQPSWITNIARNIILYGMVFIAVFVVSLPMFQDFVLTYIPKAISASGVLTTSGAFFKGLAGLGIFIALRTLFSSY
jgi:hypothetical protein